MGQECPFLPFLFDVIIKVSVIALTQEKDMETMESERQDSYL